MTNKISLVLATHNEGKRREYARLFKDVPVEVRMLSEFDGLPEVIESGTSFQEIAKGKARHAAGMLGISAIADDSGLEVEVLGGAPGIVSARYGGEPTDDARNNRKLLEAMKGKDNRRAAFVCAIAIAKPSGRTFAQITEREKSEVSHRGLAMRRLRDDFRNIAIWLETNEQKIK